MRTGADTKRQHYASLSGWRTTAIFLLLLMMSFSVAQAKEDAPKELHCGGKAGVQCPNGYACILEKSFPYATEAMGICQQIDIKTLDKCLQSRDVTVVCSTQYRCKKQRELLGDLFQYLTVQYDDNETDCKKYGTLCDTEYHDAEMIGWIIPKGAPYPLEHANRYPRPTFRGTRTMEQVMGLAGCSE